VPELPEVETTRRGIAPYVAGAAVAAVTVREPRLRWPVPRDLPRRLIGRHIEGVDRRAKYLLLGTAGGAVLVHLGMSGSLRIVTAGAPPGPHDHLDLVFASGHALRLRDPRRFGTVLWAPGDPLAHPLLRRLGPEPLAPGFGGAELHARARGRRLAVKHFLMDATVVAGVGNIYANEALFLAGIHPARAAGRISARRYDRLATALRQVFEEAIERGGTTLRDFVGGNGEPGYFSLSLRVYDRSGLPCPVCGSPVRKVILGARSSYYCPRCQR